MPDATLFPPVTRFADPAAQLLFRSSEVRAISAKYGALGCVVAVSGGVDSATALAISCDAVGHDKVVALALPDRDTDPQSTSLAEVTAECFGVRRFSVHDIDHAASAFGCFEGTQAVAAELFGDFDPHQDRIRAEFRYDLADEAALPGFYLVRVRDGQTEAVRLRAAPHRRLVAAMNIKQRVRMAYTFRIAEELGYAVVCTTNLQEYYQGFFVKNGDGSGDLFPLVDCYKSQVRQLARAAGVPAEVSERPSTTDTYSAAQSQEEFFFLWDEQKMDLILACYLAGIECERVAPLIGATSGAIERTYRLLARRRLQAERLEAGLGPATRGAPNGG